MHSNNTRQVCKSWEEAVLWMRRQPEHAALVRDAYLDEPLLEASCRFATSAEWKATRTFFPGVRGRAVDIGAGRGIGSYALSMDGWDVTAVEPDTSEIVGAGAIRSLAESVKRIITVEEDCGETMRLSDASVNLVYCRQVLHHVNNLPQFCREVARILVPGGRFVAAREHVINKPEDLGVFLDGLPLRDIYSGENAYLLDDYLGAIRQSGMRVKNVIGPFDSPINYYPFSEEQWRSQCREYLVSRVGWRMALWLTHPRLPMGGWFMNKLASRCSQLDQTPGRLYTFVAVKPGGMDQP